MSTNDLSKHGLMRSISQAIEMLDISKKTNKLIFNGLEKLKDYSKSKINWLNEVPTINEVSEKLLLSTKSLRKDKNCLLYTSDAADDMQCVDLGGRRIIKKG